MRTFPNFLSYAICYNCEFSLDFVCQLRLSDPYRLL